MKPAAAPTRLSKRRLREDLVLQTVLEVYGAIRREGRLADRALEFVLRAKKHLYSNERRAVAERVYALLRRQRWVDVLVETAVPHFSTLHPAEQDAYRVGLARWLDGTEAAEAFAGLPRKVDVTKLEAARASWEKKPLAERLAVTASLPDFLAEAFIAQWGDEATALTQAMNQRAPLMARVNTLKGDREALRAKLKAEGIFSTPTLHSPLGLTLDTRVNAFGTDAFREGFFEIQDEGSQLLGLLVDAPPKCVIDACAGAGGKTLQLAAFMKNRGELFAFDIDARRLEDLRKRARRAGVHNVRAEALASDIDEAAVAQMSGKADRVLLDAPCSGSGTLRRKPDARYRLKPEDPAMFAAKQLALCLRWADAVKPGGRLIYGTCSVLKIENRDVVAAFLKERPDFSVMPVSQVLGAELAQALGCPEYLELLPHRHGTDGFFGAVLVRATGALPLSH